MRPRNAGAIVQVGSALAYRAIPLQSAYCAASSPSAASPIRCAPSCCTSGPASPCRMLQMPGMNTPQFDWARNKFDRQVPAGRRRLRPRRRRRRRLARGARRSARALGRRQRDPGDHRPDAVRRRCSTASRASGWDGQISDDPEPARRPDNLYRAGAPADVAARGRFGATRQAEGVDHRPDARVAASLRRRLRRGLVAAVAARGAGAARGAAHDASSLGELQRRTAARAERDADEHPAHAQADLHDRDRHRVQLPDRAGRQAARRAGGDRPLRALARGLRALPRRSARATSATACPTTACTSGPAGTTGASPTRCCPRCGTAA